MHALTAAWLLSLYDFAEDGLADAATDAEHRAYMDALDDIGAELESAGISPDCLRT